MFILLSPAKTLDFDSPLPSKKHSDCHFLEDAQYLNNKLKKLSSSRLQSLMGISATLGDLNYQRNQDWSLPFDLNNSRQAVFAFMGDVYTGLEASQLSSADMDFAQQYLRIISGLYGLLKPLDLIQAYRLEMGCGFKVTASKSNLYKYWGDRLTEHLKSEMAGKDTQVIVNLASKEYYKAVKHKSIDNLVIEPQFKDFKNGEYKMISFFAKKARGMMASFLIRHRITDPSNIKAFDSDGYSFNNKLSSEKGMIFTRG